MKATKEAKTIKLVLCISYEKGKIVGEGGYQENKYMKAMQQY